VCERGVGLNQLEAVVGEREFRRTGDPGTKGWIDEQTS
jgi:hypothetical protein